MWRVCFGFLLAASSGCHGRLTRLAQAGRYDDVIVRAQDAKRPPRRAQARAYATALAATGHTDHARTVLLDDFRHGGVVESLVALADLEHRLGLEGVALTHYDHVVTLDPGALSGRNDVCDLFVRRAQLFWAMHERDAAKHDVNRVATLCRELSPLRFPPGREGRLAGAPSVAERCGAGGCVGLAQQLANARAKGPVALRAYSIRFGAALEVDDVISILQAELVGALDADILSDAALRTVVGDREIGEFSAALELLDEGQGAFVVLRLAAVIDVGMPKNPALRGRQIDRWVGRAAEAAGPHAYRVYAWRGDLNIAELALTTAFAPRLGARPVSEGARGERWVAGLALDQRTLPLALAAARLRLAAGHRDVALRLQRKTLAHAVAANVPGAADLAAREATRAIAWGRPWHAIAMVEGLDLPELGPVRAAASSGILLKRAFCGGDCTFDVDAQAVARVLGESWVRTRLGALEELALAQPSRRSPDRTWVCPSAEEIFAADAVGPLAHAIAAERSEPGDPSHAPLFRIAIESDPSLVCAARYVVPILSAYGHRLGAVTLANMLAYGPEMRASRQLEVHAALAAIAHQPQRAEFLIRAAAAQSQNPRATWLAMANVAREQDMASLHRLALREALLHTSKLEDPVIRRELLIRAITDGTGSPRRAAPDAARLVDDTLVAEPPALRASLSHAVKRRLDAPQPEYLKTAFDDHRLAAKLAENPGMAMPGVIEAFADPSEFERSRLAVAGRARSWRARSAAAVGVASYGSSMGRAQAVAVLRKMSTADPRATPRIDRLVLRRPSALDLASSAPVRAVGMLEDALMVRILLGLDLAPVPPPR